VLIVEVNFFFSFPFMTTFSHRGNGLQEIIEPFLLDNCRALLKEYIDKERKSGLPVSLLWRDPSFL